MRRGFLKPKQRASAQTPTIASTSNVSFTPSKPIPSIIKIPTIRVTTPGESLDAPTYVDDPRSNTRHMYSTKLPYQSHYHGPQIMTLMLYPGMEEKILAMFSSYTPFPTLPPQPRYHIGPVTGRGSGEGRGLGMFAAVDIKIGDLIACEGALLISPLSVEYAPHLVSDPFERFVNFMEPPQREAFMKLSNCKGHKSKFLGIIDTNALPVGALPGYAGAYLGIFRDISRVNHSCSPNALQRWDLPSFTYAIRAIRPILAGEQIFISYTNTFMSRHDRQEELLQKYSFKCACPSCSLSPAESAKSDINRYVLHQKRDPTDERDLHAWAADPSLPDDHIIKAGLFAAEMMDKEGVYVGVWDYYYQRLCKAYCALSNEPEARRWAEKAAALTEACTGNDGGWGKVIASPRNTNWWGIRVKKHGEKIDS